MVNGFEHLGDGILALGLLTKHIFLASRGIEIDTTYTCALLTTVVLFLHHQIEFVQAIAPRTVFLFVVAQRLQQANHRHTTFMLQLLHNFIYYVFA